MPNACSTLASPTRSPPTRVGGRPRLDTALHLLAGRTRILLFTHTGARHWGEPLSTDVIDRILLAIASGTGTVNADDGAEFGRALTDLADRIERAVTILRQLVDLADPRGTPTELRLTPRELEVLSQLAEGRSNHEIARLCWISDNTVKFHMKNIFRKLGVRERGQAVMIARAMQKWIENPRPNR